MRPLVRWMSAVLLAGALACSGGESSQDPGPTGGAGTPAAGAPQGMGGRAGTQAGRGGAGAGAGGSGTSAGRGGSSGAGSSGAGSSGVGGGAGASGASGADETGVGARPSRDGGRYVAMISPTPGEGFVAPSELRLFASAYDPNVYTNEPTDGHGTNAKTVEFFVDDESAGTQDGLDAEYCIFRGKATGVAAGQHRVWARATYEDPALVLDSDPVLIDVAEPPDYADVVELDADVVLSGSTAYELSGTPNGRIRLNGNGHRIVSQGSASGTLTLTYVDAFGLGPADEPGTSGIDVATSGAIVIDNSTFDTSNTLSFKANGTASIRNNLFRSNMREPLGQLPDGPSTLPSVALGGTGTARKVFAGNNVGNGAVELDRTEHWLVGAAPDGGDEDSNVLIGPRVGVHVTDSSDVEVRRNYSHHVYFGGWSQGNNFELQGSPSSLIEHNVIAGSSWPSRGVACEFRYNLVLDAGHEWLWPADGGSIHHNVFVGGDNDVGGIYVLYEPKSVTFRNNTLDGLLGGAIAVLMDSGNLTLTSNAFVNFPKGPTVDIRGGTVSADYNAFLNPDADDYSDGRTPSHDVSGIEPAFHDPPSETLDLDEAGVWQRATTTASVLALYRARYTPESGSPLVDAGDPADGAGNDIGAVGAGAADDADRFGKP
ncbi:MAG TPA: right-handed parallel beta-helix repeat-containing protein [Polyangiaceae bacterium]|nr:right-handed parallel beta-helix repeat-containing protein [Polyangiaceae bacterium]